MLQARLYRRYHICIIKPGENYYYGADAKRRAVLCARAVFVIVVHIIRQRAGNRLCLQTRKHPLYTTFCLREDDNNDYEYKYNDNGNDDEV
jgi:hypothetical protein